MTDQTADQMADTAGGQDDHDAECVESCTATTCFDMSSCDELEAMLIERMRTMLRPQTAPECLYERIRATLDRCCEERRRQTSSITHVTHVTSVTGMQGTSTSLMHATIIHREVHD
ncbi:hypothetical protein [Bifidobacterium gallicum]|nr:hypothetical protein [Bifidobacterium gallicum]